MKLLISLSVLAVVGVVGYFTCTNTLSPKVRAPMSHAEFLEKARRRKPNPMIIDFYQIEIDALQESARQQGGPSSARGSSANASFQEMRVRAKRIKELQKKIAEEQAKTP